MNIWTQRRTIVAYALSIIALAEIVDLTIVSVAIPDLMGALGANINQVSLTMTSYIVAAAICIPLTGMFTKKFGLRNVALYSTLIFGIASIFCGTATSLEQMIVYRLIQGVGGAFLPALAQAYVVDNFTLEEQPKVMSVLTICIVLGPIIGPVMGGYIIEHMNWRWIFYVNVPICILGFTLIAILMEDSECVDVSIDYVSFIFMAVGMGCLEYFVDEGNSHNWLDSITMIYIITFAVIFLGFFIWRGLLGKSVVNFAIFRNSNFVLSCAILFIFFTMLSGCLSFYPSMLQRVYHFPVDTAGYIQAPRGIAAVVGAPLYIILSKKIDARALIAFAMLLAGISTLAMGYLSVDYSIEILIILVIIQGLGMIGVFVLLMTIAYVGIGENLAADSSGILNFFRNFSASIGTSIASTILSQQQQVNWHSMGRYVNWYSRGFNHWAGNITWSLSMKSGVMAALVANAAILQGYLNVFHLNGLVLILIAWTPFLLKKPDPQAKLNMGH